MTERDSNNKIENQRPKFLSSKRREFLRTATGVAGLTTFGTAGLATAKSENAGRFDEDPFTLGVASGDPLSDSVVLWTRLALDPLKADGDMPDQKIEVQWKIASDKKNGKARRSSKMALYMLVQSTSALCMSNRRAWNQTPNITISSR